VFIFEFSMLQTNKQVRMEIQQAWECVTPPSLGSSDADSTRHVAVQGCCEEATFRPRS
jgi:hypothetical protein